MDDAEESPPSGDQHSGGRLPDRASVSVQRDPPCPEERAIPDDDLLPIERRDDAKPLGCT